MIKPQKSWNFPFCIKWWKFLVLIFKRSLQLLCCTRWTDAVKHKVDLESLEALIWIWVDFRKRNWTDKILNLLWHQRLYVSIWRYAYEKSIKNEGMDGIKTNICVSHVFWGEVRLIGKTGSGQFCNEMIVSCCVFSISVKSRCQCYGVEQSWIMPHITVFLDGRWSKDGLATSKIRCRLRLNNYKCGLKW